MFSNLSPARYAGLAVGSFVFLAALWVVTSLNGWIDPAFLPSPSRIAAELWAELGDPQWWSHVGISVWRVTVGFLLAASLAVPLGILAGAYGWMDALVAPLCEFIRYIPVPALLPLIMVWAGIGEWAKILVIAVGSFFQMVLMVADDTRSVSREWLQAAFTLGAKTRQAFFLVLIPAILPRLTNTVRLVLGWAWTYLVVAELVAANSGLGFAIMKAQRFLRTDTVFTGILAIGLLGLITDRLLVLLHRKAFPYLEGR